MAGAGISYKIEYLRINRTCPASTCGIFHTLYEPKFQVVSDPTPGVWGRPRGTSAGLYRGLPYKPGHAYETNPRHRGGNRGSERRVREAEEDTREAEEDKE